MRAVFYSQSPPRQHSDHDRGPEHDRGPADPVGSAELRVASCAWGLHSQLVTRNWQLPRIRLAADAGLNWDPASARGKDDGAAAGVHLVPLPARAGLCSARLCFAGPRVIETVKFDEWRKPRGLLIRLAALARSAAFFIGDLGVLAVHFSPASFFASTSFAAA